MTSETVIVQDLKLRQITSEGFAPYGKLIEQTEDGVPFGLTDARLDLGGGLPRFYIMRLEHRAPLVKQITRHLGVTQLLASVGGKAWQLAVAPPRDPDNVAGEPIPQEIVAFDIPGNVAVMLYRGTWHAGPYFEADETSFFNLELTDTNITDHHSCKIAARFGVAYRLMRN